MKRRPFRAKRCARRVAVVGLALVIALQSPPTRAEPLSDAELETRIRDLEQERTGIALGGPIAGVAVGAVLFQGGLSSIVSIQYNCPGYWDCSDETRWGLTAGAGAAIVLGAITIGLAGPALSKRLRERRELRQKIYELRMRKSESESGSESNAESLSQEPSPSWTLGIGVTDERRDFRVWLRY
jgi:hypothetical protein